MQGNSNLNQITVKEGSIYVEGRETSNPTEIGYALIDYAKDNPEFKLNLINSNR